MGGRSRALLSLIVAILLVASAAHATGDETKPYVSWRVRLVGLRATTGPLPGSPLGDCSGSTPSPGGTCFNIPSGATSVSVTIQDAVDSNVGAALTFFDSGVVFAHPYGVDTFICGSGSATVPSPEATQLWVFLGYTSSCPSAGTTGTITASFSLAG